MNLKSEKPSAKQIKAGVEEVLQNPVYKRNLEVLSNEFRQYNPRLLCQQYVNEVHPVGTANSKPVAVQARFPLAHHSPNNAMELTIHNLFKTHANGVKALNGVNLRIGPGLFGLLGPNGAGKSTLVQILATLQEPDAGQIRLGDLDAYLKGRYAERKKEVPLARVENQPYIHYRKGSLALYALQDYLGEDRLNQALRGFLDETRYQSRPYPDSRQLVTHLRRATPDSLQYHIGDLFETITLFDNGLTSAGYTRRPDGSCEVKLSVRSEKPAERASTPYNHISLDWASHGHPLPGIYDVPHFDMHFYMISEAEQDAIVMDDKMQRLPEARFLPPADRYVSTPGEGVPGMGKHWGDITSPELAQGKPFTATLMYGSYDGKVIFYEPMIAHNWLQSRPAQFDTVMPIAQPAAFQKTAHYPTQYSVSYDASKGGYTISLTGLISRRQQD